MLKEDEECEEEKGERAAFRGKKILENKNLEE